MKKLLFVIFICLVSFSYVSAADLIVYDKVESTGGISDSTLSTGAFQSITVPSGVESLRHILIQVNDGSATVSDSTEGFLFSFNSDGSDPTYVSELGMVLPMGKKTGEVIGYVKTASSGSYIAILGLR